MNCDFCSVTAFNGSHYRYRPIDEVIDEMAEIPQKNIFILDDNIVGNNAKAQARAIELFRAMIDRGIRKDWIGQASLNVADNEEVLKYADQIRDILKKLESVPAQSVKKPSGENEAKPAAKRGPKPKKANQKAAPKKRGRKPKEGETTPALA